MLKTLYGKVRNYGIFGLICGIYFRELTKIFKFEGNSQLGGVHTHVLMLGMFFFLIVMILVKVFEIDKDAKYKKFITIYENGFHLTITMMLIRGTLQVIGTELSTMVDASISGFAGIGHILMGVGFILLFGVLKRSID